MNLQEQISRIQSMMGIITEGNKINRFSKIMSMAFPNFNKEGVDVEEKEFRTLYKYIDKVEEKEFGTFYKYIDKNDPNLLYAKYWTSDKELQLNREIFDFLNNFTSDDIFDEVINWFNNEFGTDAKQVTF